MNLGLPIAPIAESGPQWALWKAGRGYAGGLALVLTIYVVVLGTFLIATGGLPYVMDNNETYSSIVHAYNLLHFDLGASFGLTDEAYGPSAAAHPYVYTHQGNFPRFFALLIYVLGARSAEAQIVITAFTVGTLGVFCAYDVMARRAAPWVAVLFCAVLITDYLMIMQWQTVAWRAWHIVFFFGALLCIDRVATRRGRGRLVALAGLHAAMFYFELLFAAFTAAAAGLYFLISYWNWKKLPVVLAVQFLGLVVGVGTLILQLIGYLGWEGFLRDLYLTFMARNRIQDPETLRRVISAFMEHHHIVFWYNFGGIADLRRSLVFDKFFSYGFGIYSPAMAYMSYLGLIGLASHWLVRRLLVLCGRYRRLRVMMSLDTARVFVLGGFYIVAAYGYSAFSGLTPPLLEQVFFTASCLLLALNLNGVLERLAVDEQLPWPALVPIGVLALVGCAVALPNAGIYYGPKLGQLWSNVNVGLFNKLIIAAITLTAWASLRCGLLAVSRHEERYVGDASRCLVPFVAGLLAFVVVYMLSPGYVQTGYLERNVPLIAFACLVGVAAPLVSAVALLPQVGSWWPFAPFMGKGVRRGLGASFMRRVQFTYVPFVLAAGAAIGVFGYWLWVQIIYLERLPPDQAGYLTALRAPQFQGKSFAANTYAAPISVETGAWAYLDPSLGARKIFEIDGKYDIERDHRYLWLADRATNPDYLYPDYFLCFAGSGLYVATPVRRPVCAVVPLVGQANQSIPGVLDTEIVARDPQDRWAIVQLHWHAKRIRKEQSE